MAFRWQLCVLVSTPLLGSCALVLNPGADAPLSPLAESALEGLRERAVATRARSLDPPADLEASARVVRGAADYERLCAGCHLAPGREATQLGDKSFGTVGKTTLAGRYDYVDSNIGLHHTVAASCGYQVRTFWNVRGEVA